MSSTTTRRFASAIGIYLIHFNEVRGVFWYFGIWKNIAMSKKQDVFQTESPCSSDLFFCFRSILAELDKGVHLDQIMIETTGTAFEGRAVRAFETWIRQMNFWMLQYYDQCPEFMWLQPEIWSWIYHQHIPNLSKIIILYCGQIWRKHVGFGHHFCPAGPSLSLMDFIMVFLQDTSCIFD